MKGALSLPVPCITLAAGPVLAIAPATNDSPPASANSRDATGKRTVTVTLKATSVPKPSR